MTFRRTPQGSDETSPLCSVHSSVSPLKSSVCFSIPLWTVYHPRSGKSIYKIYKNLIPGNLFFVYFFMNLFLTFRPGCDTIVRQLDGPGGVYFGKFDKIFTNLQILEKIYRFSELKYFDAVARVAGNKKGAGQATCSCNHFVIFLLSLLHRILTAPPFLALSLSILHQVKTNFLNSSKFIS